MLDDNMMQIEEHSSSPKTWRHNRHKMATQETTLVALRPPARTTLYEKDSKCAHTLVTRTPYSILQRLSLSPESPAASKVLLY